MRFAVTAVLSILILGLFLSLGFWQVQRLQWKAGVLADIDARIKAAPVAVPALPTPEADRYLPVMVQGVLGQGGVRVLASSRDFGPGYRIIQALRLESGRLVLLDLGFQRISQQEEASLPHAIAVTGNLHWPDELDNWTPAPEPDNALWFARDIATISAYLGTEPVLIVAREITPAVTGILPMPVTSEGVANRHLEYAVTWFLLAATWLLMTGLALWRMKRRTF